MHLKSVFELLQHAEGEVYGLQEPVENPEPLLADFVAGRLDENQRKIICAWLRQNPARISEVAEAIKRNRSGSI